MQGVSKDRVRLAPGSIPAHADPYGDYINIGMAHTLFRCGMPTPRRPIARPAVQSMSLAAAGLSRDPVMLLPVVAFACALQATSHSLLCAAVAAQKSRSRVRGFGGVFTFLL